MPHPSFPVRAALSALCLAGAAVVPSAPALAQGVTLYGLLDASVEHLTDVGQGGASLNRMPGLTGSVPSRIGLRGSEDLGGGLRALFTMEQGLALDAGVLNQGGRAWGRQAFVGLSGDWGSLTLGRQYTMLYWSQLDADILGPNAYGAASLDSYLPNARADNALAWRAGLGGFTVGATYSLGRDAVNAGPGPAGTNCPGEQPGDSSACRQWSAMLKYEAKAWGIALAVDEIRGGPGAFAGLTSSARKDRRSTAAGWVRWGAWKLGAGVIARHNDGRPDAPRSDLWYLGASFAATPALTLDAQALDLRFRRSDDGARLFALRAQYSLSKRTTLYATAGHLSNEGALALSVSNAAPGAAPAPGRSQNGFAAGVRHSF
ncbi:putative porin [Delftia sp. 60]|uniref:porin n=1 Tax=Delftia sp. 60 TaxID=2035216 RepID=UPI000C18AA6E|nr:porin [Delftia sp. 60]PIF39169.1 putative porin [Burkholderiales bacterium 23]PIF65652.1 putative porin [Delftia sp. 60]